MSAENELIAQARRGDARATDDLIMLWQPRILRFGVRICRSEEDARDVLQETLLAALQGLSEFRGEAAPSTWLFQIARSHCTRARRGAMSRAPMLGIEALEHAHDEAASPEDLAHARQLGSRIAVALAKLRPVHREAIVLRDIEGLSAAEAAAIAKTDVPALKSRLHRARAELRAMLR